MSISFRGITFRYWRSASPVLDEFSWDVPMGRTVLLGPNGAGKTTLLSIGADLLRPKRGQVLLGNLNPRRRTQRGQYRRAVGWMPQQIRAVPGLTAREQVAYAGWLKGLSRSGAWESAAQALDRVGLRNLMDRKASELSGGQLRRVGLAQVLVHSPSVMLLDEPSVGLDPAQRARFREILYELPPDVPVVVSTHQVDDLSELFNTVVVLESGKLRFTGTVEDFMSLATSNLDGRNAEIAYSKVINGEY